MIQYAAMPMPIRKVDEIAKPNASLRPKVQFLFMMRRSLNPSTGGSVRLPWCVPMTARCLCRLRRTEDACDLGHETVVIDGFFYVAVKDGRQHAFAVALHHIGGQRHHRY